MREVIERFGKLVRVVETPDREHRFLAQPTTQMLIDLVRECLLFFTPWNTTCTLPASFDPTDKIPALFFSGTDSDDESLIELNRFHTALHPDCFSRIVASLGFDSPDKRLAMPQFFLSNGDTPRGDRSKPPPLAEADYRQFKQTREQRSAAAELSLHADCRFTSMVLNAPPSILVTSLGWRSGLNRPLMRSRCAGKMAEATCRL